MASPRASGMNSHVVADQDAVFSFLSNPRTYDLPVGDVVQRIDTHGAVVFLAGPYAYKVKRAVFFPFMDFSTLEKRRAACEAEFRIGQTNAPELYLDVVPITRTEAGFSLNGAGMVCEYAVRMHRFDVNDTLDHLAARGEFSPQLVAALAQAISASHQKASVSQGYDTGAAFLDFLADNRSAFLRHPSLFPAGQASRLCDEMEQSFARLRPLLHKRSEQGYVRWCHGDLHLRNIVMLEGRPVLFDAIEFNKDIAICDILYDLSFLLMDLWERGLHGTANGLFNRYMRIGDDSENLDGIAALPFFLSMRAAIRAKVEAAGLEHLSGAKRQAAEQRVIHLFHTARAFMCPSSASPIAPAESARTPAPPRALTTDQQLLVAIGGLSGSGKSTCAMAWAPYIGRAPGALVLRSDIERKLMFGVAETEPLPSSAYRPEVTEQVYARLSSLASRALATGQSVIVDAVHALPAERAAIEKVAQAAGVAFIGVWLETDVSTRIERIDQRTGDASDADADIARRQQSYDIGPLGEWLVVKTG